MSIYQALFGFSLLSILILVIIMVIGLSLMVYREHKDWLANRKEKK